MEGEGIISTAKWGSLCPRLLAQAPSWEVSLLPSSGCSGSCAWGISVSIPVALIAPRSLSAPSPDNRMNLALAPLCLRLQGVSCLAATKGACTSNDRIKLVNPAGS